MAGVYFYLIDPIFNLVFWIVIINAILSWLVAFNVVNPRNQAVSMVGRFTSAVTEPLLAPFRRFIPSLGGVDISPILLLLILQFVNRGVLMPLMVQGPA